ncbi:hypothetical protein [Aeoliella sp.]|uniref:hypothetical protein n=1 Tax=Aeoliella sp. TaxID=2795800 RepID=UPI003CCC40CC
MSQLASINRERDQWSAALGVSVDAPAVEVCQAFEQFAHKLAPQDLAGWPMYCLAVSSLPDDYAKAARFRGGWHNARSYFSVSRHLPRDAGYGPCLFVNDLLSHELALQLVTGAQTALARRGEIETIDELLQYVQWRRPIEFLCRVLTHELGHAIEYLVDGEFECMKAVHDRLPIARANLTRNQDAYLAADAATETSRPEPPPPQVDAHGLRFTRIMAHLQYRLSMLGVDAVAHDVAGERFNQRHFAACEVALGNEPYKYIDQSFESILALPFPPEFAACQLKTRSAADADAALARA